MSALLKGLEQHKEVQPEVAVFCKVGCGVEASFLEHASGCAALKP
jgi:hypothetical protein